MELTQYQIILVNLDPTLGAEMKKTRPCVIISPNEMNTSLSTIIIAPITNTIRAYPTRLILNNTHITGAIVLDQLRTIDKTRVIKTIGHLGIDQIQNLKNTIKEMLVD